MRQHAVVPALSEIPITSRQHSHAQSWLPHLATSVRWFHPNGQLNSTMLLFHSPLRRGLFFLFKSYSVPFFPHSLFLLNGVPLHNLDVIQCLDLFLCNEKARHLRKQTVPSISLDM